MKEAMSEEVSTCEWYLRVLGADLTGLYGSQEALHGLGGSSIEADMLQCQSYASLQAALRLVIEGRNNDLGRAGQ